MARMPNLQRHPKSGVWRVRVRVPGDCRAVIRKPEILHSLRTKDEKEARRLAFPIFHEIETLFRRIRAGEPVRWSNGKVWEPADDYYEVLASQFLIARAADFEPGDLEGLPPDYDLPGSLERFLREKGIAARRDSVTFANLLGEVRSELSLNDTIPKPPTRMERRNEHVVESKGASDPPLSKLLDGYLAEEKPSPQTSEEWRTLVRRFTDFLGGDVNVRSITVADVREFKAALRRASR